MEEIYKTGGLIRYRNGDVSIIPAQKLINGKWIFIDENENPLPTEKQEKYA